MQYQGTCHKMKTDLSEHNPHQSKTYSNVIYHFVLDKTPVPQQIKLGQNITIEWTGQIFCISCGAKTPKSYAQGFCFKCFKTSPESDLCLVKPETCHYDSGTCRDQQFALDTCFQPHIVYLANSSGLKVGITRQQNQPSRWLDQGAIQALPILSVGSRRLSGQLEHLLSSELADKTDWRKLLKGDAEPLDLMTLKDHILDQFAIKIQQIREQFKQNISFNEYLQELNNTTFNFNYPILHYPEKIKSLNLEKTPSISGVLYGIKGQYLILNTGVINIRKYTGYELKLIYD